MKHLLLKSSSLSNCKYSFNLTITSLYTWLDTERFWLVLLQTDKHLVIFIYRKDRLTNLNVTEVPECMKRALTTEQTLGEEKITEEDIKKTNKQL